MKEFFKSLFFKNWQYKLGALLAAVTLWFYIASEQNLTVVLNLPVELNNFPSEMRMINKVENAVDVMVTGRRDIVNNINKKNVKVTLNLKTAKEGKNIYRISPAVIVSLPRGLDIKSITPYQVEIEFEKTNNSQSGEGKK